MKVPIIKIVQKKYKRMIKVLSRKIKFVLSPLLNYVKVKDFRLRVQYTNYLNKLPVDKHMVLYEAYHGKSLTGNPFAIFKGIYSMEEYKNFKHIWVINDFDNIHLEYRNVKNIKFIKVHSREYVKYLATAKYLINDTSFPSYFQKRSEQVYVNTWHGTPLKTLGTDIKNSKLTSHKNIQRNLLHSDYLVSPNKFTYQKLLGSHGINNLYNGKVLDIGYPRVDSMLFADSNKVRKALSIPQGKRVILYAPTWRGQVHNENDTSEKLLKELEIIKANVSDEYVVLLKSHYFAYKFFVSKNLEYLCVPDSMDTNELLSVVDILITDYSSIFFDYLPTMKPILFYADDFEEYERDRGFYIDTNTLPGPICKEISEVVECINDIEKVAVDYEENYEAFLKEYCYNDNGLATRKFIDIVFKQNDSKEVIPFSQDNNKIKILIYCGGFYNNGITISAINLLNRIDYEKYDVTVLDFGNGDNNVEKRNNILKLNPKVSILYRVGKWNLTLKEQYMHSLVLKRGLYSDFMKRNAPIDMYQREISRLVGNSKFDVSIDFGGYNPFWSLLMAFGDFAKKNIYLHNDMMEEYNKKINGKYKHRPNLKVIFSLYDYFDSVVSVAKSTNEENQNNLGDFVNSPKEKMVYVNNIIDYDRVLSLKENQEVIINDDIEYLISNKKVDFGAISTKGIIKPSVENINFINIGRMSPEKDQEKLITAFASIEHEYANVRLYIVGEGPLENKLKTLARELRIEHKVFFTGQLDNVFALLSNCQCFVLSSNYEGQGLVLLESLILRIPTIATDVTGVRSVLENGYGLLVDNTLEDLKEGMLKFINGEKLSTKNFDYKAYNNEAIQMFYEKVAK
jgi:CDP-glycerol glycerophosphotransferase